MTELLDPVREFDVAPTETERTMPLHVWTADKEEWVVAESAEDACAVYCEHIGHGPESDPDNADGGCHPDHWSQLPDESVVKIQEECPEHHKKGRACPRGCDSNYLIHTAFTCAEHAQQTGRGYLCSANW